MSSQLWSMMLLAVKYNESVFLPLVFPGKLFVFIYCENLFRLHSITNFTLSEEKLAYLFMTENYKLLILCFWKPINKKRSQNVNRQATMFPQHCEGTRQFLSWYIRRFRIRNRYIWLPVLAGIQWGWPKVHRGGRKDQSAGENEEAEPAQAGVNWWCQYMKCSALDTKTEFQSWSEFQRCQFPVKEVAESIAPNMNRCVQEMYFRIVAVKWKHQPKKNIFVNHCSYLLWFKLWKSCWWWSVYYSEPVGLSIANAHMHCYFIFEMFFSISDLVYFLCNLLEAVYVLL